MWAVLQLYRFILSPESLFYLLNPDTTPCSSPACLREKRYCYFSFGSKCPSLFPQVVSTHVSDVSSLERKIWAT